MTLRSKQGSSRVPQALLVCAILSAACGATSGGGVGGAGGMGPGGADVGGDRGGGAGVGGARGGAGVGGDRGGGAGVGGASGGAGFGGQNPLGRTRCHAPAGVSAAPKTIEEAVALLNALPKPTTVACFVESLERPLSAVATSSIFSAQPAVSRESPRLFLKRDRLWLSVVVAGPSSQVLELSYVVDNELLRSTKGELQLPLEQTLALSAPYDRVQFSQGTVCGFCHASESLELTATFDNVFSSAVLRPRPDTYVALDALRVENQNCDWQVEPERCEMLSAIFDGGPVNEAAFPDSTPTFF